jgi:hypothetical protein
MLGQVGGQDFTITSGINMGYSIVLENADLSIFTLIMTFDKFDIKLNMPMMGYNDSTVVMKEYLGKRMKLVVTDLGKTISITPIDTIPPSRIQMIAGIDPSDLCRRLFIELPEKEVDINSTWKKELPDTTIKNGIKMLIKHNIDFIVVGAESKAEYNCWKIAINGKSAIEGSGSQGGNDVTIDGTVRVGGAVYFAPKEGIFISAEQPMETDLTTTVTGPQSMVQTMSINTLTRGNLLK